MEIIEYNPVNIRSAAGSFSLKLNNGIVINSMTLFRKGDSVWVSPPSRKVTAGTEVKYVPFILFEDPQVNKQFLEAAKKAVLEYLSANGISLEEAPRAEVVSMPSPGRHPGDEGLPF